MAEDGTGGTAADGGADTRQGEPRDVTVIGGQEIENELVDEFVKQRAERRRIERQLQEEMRMERSGKQVGSVLKSEPGDSDGDEYDQHGNANATSSTSTSTQKPASKSAGTGFIWKRKREQELYKGITLDQRVEHDKSRIEEAQREIERIKIAREERERERKERDEERVRRQREQDEKTHGNWKEYEQKFHLDQAKLRSQIRIKQNRSKPIDAIVLNFYLAVDSKIVELLEIKDLDFQSFVTEEEYYSSFDGLSVESLEGLLDDIKQYQRLEIDNGNIEFWKNLQIVCESELERKRNGKPIPGIEDNVVTDMETLFKGKTFAQLSMLQLQLQEKIHGLYQEESPLLGYWESAMELLKVYKSKSLLEARRSELAEMKRVHMEEIENIRAEELERERQLLRAQQHDILPLDKQLDLKTVATATNKRVLPDFNNEDLEDDKDLIDDEDKIHYEPWMSPRASLISIDGETGIPAKDFTAILPNGGPKINLSLPSFPVISTLEDFGSVCESRDVAFNSSECILNQTVVGAKRAKYSVDNQDRKSLQKGLNTGNVDEADEAWAPQRSGHDDMNGSSSNTVAVTGEEEGAFNDEVSSEEQQARRKIQMKMRKYTWQDKYRPRKPKYFNRVHTGYEWNQYNRTHYDSDNPPPKVVQGYKFNIFYPDLLDKSVTPTFAKVRDEGFPDTILLKFSAGAPYEDIAFRIINREWECVPRRGFKCVFDRGALQLWFKFKKQRYRR